MKPAPDNSKSGRLNTENADARHQVINYENDVNTRVNISINN